MVGDAAAQACAICHLDAGLSRDWVYRANLHFDGASGAIPQPPAGQAADKPFIDNYTFVPGTTTVPVGTRVTWTNDDQVKHTVTATNGNFSELVSQGASFSRTFSGPVGSRQALAPYPIVASLPGRRATMACGVGGFLVPAVLTQ